MFDHKMLTEISRTIGMPEETILSALEEALALSLHESMRIYDCDVDIKAGTATLILKIPESISLKEALFLKNTAIEGDLISVRIGFEALPDNVRNYCKNIFPKMLAEIDTTAGYRKWMEKRKTAVEGVVLEKNDTFITVDLGNQLGILEKAEWIPEEISKYRNGYPMIFFITRVQKEKASVRVYLSRRSKNLPGVMLKQKLPWHDFKVTWRRAGFKSMIKTGCHFKNPALEKIKKEVENELHEILIFEN